MIRYAKNLGFCMGVRNAVNVALSTQGNNVFSFGEIIHNPTVTEKLNKKGIVVIESIDELAPNSTVIIRSHGVGKDIYDKLTEKNFKIIDATCPFVKNIHNIVKEHHDKGYQIVIFGNPEHPEVKGINGWCENSAVIVSDGTFLDKPEYEKLCIVSQTTANVAKYSDFLQKILQIGSKSVAVFDTICYTTVTRQSEAVEIASQSDAVLVLGSRSSSNTNKLFETAKKYCDAVFFVESVAELKNIKFTYDNIGVIAGASTPDELIMEVKVYMSQNAIGEVLVSDELKAGVEESLMSYKEGKKVKGTVLSADEKGVRVNIGGKYDGIIYKEETAISGEYNAADFPEGMEVEAIIIGKRDADKTDNLVPLSKKRVDLIKEGDKVVETIRNGEVFELTANSDTKGGLLGRLGTYTVFIPSSQIKEKGYPKDLKAYVKKKLRLTALEIDDNKHKIVASQSKVLQAERKEREEIFWTHVVPDVVVSGTVKRITNFGAFVSVDGFDCLAHIVDLSWNHIKTVDEVLKIGQTYDFLVLNIDREKGRVSLGYKQLQPHPFTVAMEKYPIGSIVKGKVVSIVPFGAFVQIEQGIEGLVHVSEAAHSFVKNINEVVKVGDEVDVKILAVDEASRRITLSMKACIEEEAKPEEVKSEAAPKARKSERKPKNTEEEEHVEWSEDLSNNPFADLLKGVEVDN